MDNAFRYFATTVGLITTKGEKYGQNVMAAEWTMQIAYEPMLVVISVHDSPTYWNIEETRVFGINIASDEQSNLVNIAGGYSGTEINKLSIPGIFQTYNAKHIQVPMVRGCVLNAECKVVSIQKMGDHIMVIGKVVSAQFDKEKFPLIYTRGNYRKLSRSKLPSGRKTVRLSPTQMSSFKQLSRREFVLKCAAAFVKDRDQVLLQKFNGYWTLPFVVVRKGEGYAYTLAQYLNSIGVTANIKEINRLARMKFKSENTELRANFVVFQYQLVSLDTTKAKLFAKMPRNILLRSLLE